MLEARQVKAQGAAEAVEVVSATPASLEVGPPAVQVVAMTFFMAEAQAEQTLTMEALAQLPIQGMVVEGEEEEVLLAVMAVMVALASTGMLHMAPVVVLEETEAAQV